MTSGPDRTNPSSAGGQPPSGSGPPASRSGPLADVTPAQARQLIDSGRVRVLDVRTPEEFAELGHIPGARLVPVQELAARATQLGSPAPDETLLVICEHGVRSRWAAQFLAGQGWPAVRNVLGGMSAWPYERERGISDEAEDQPGMPSHWLVKNLPLVPWGRALDLASGDGRNALLLARLGWKVTAIDRDRAALDRLEASAASYRMRVETIERDLESGGGVADPPLPAFDLAIVIRYLHRPLFPALRAAVRPGGAIVYETFTTGQAAFGKPSNPDFLLEPGELKERFAGFEILAEREGIVAGRRAVAGIVVRRPAA